MLTKLISKASILRGLALILAVLMTASMCLVGCSDADAQAAAEEAKSIAELAQKAADAAEKAAADAVTSAKLQDALNAYLKSADAYTQAQAAADISNAVAGLAKDADVKGLKTDVDTLKAELSKAVAGDSYSKAEIDAKLAAIGADPKTIADIQTALAKLEATVDGAVKALASLQSDAEAIKAAIASGAATGGVTKATAEELIGAALEAHDGEWVAITAEIATNLEEINDALKTINGSEYRKVDYDAVCEKLGNYIHRDGDGKVALDKDGKLELSEFLELSIIRALGTENLGEIVATFKEAAKISSITAEVEKIETLIDAAGTDFAMTAVPVKYTATTTDAVFVVKFTFGDVTFQTPEFKEATDKEDFKKDDLVYSANKDTDKKIVSYDFKVVTAVDAKGKITATTPYVTKIMTANDGDDLTAIYDALEELALYLYNTDKADWKKSTKDTPIKAGNVIVARIDEDAFQAVEGSGALSLRLVKGTDTDVTKLNTTVVTDEDANIRDLLKAPFEGAKDTIADVALSNYESRLVWLETCYDAFTTLAAKDVKATVFTATETDIKLTKKDSEGKNDILRDIETWAENMHIATPSDVKAEYEKLIKAADEKIDLYTYANKGNTDAIAAAIAIVTEAKASLTAYENGTIYEATQKADKITYTNKVGAIMSTLYNRAQDTNTDVYPLRNAETISAMDTIIGNYFTTANAVKFEDVYATIKALTGKDFAEKCDKYLVDTYYKQAYADLDEAYAHYNKWLTARQNAVDALASYTNLYLAVADIATASDVVKSKASATNVYYTYKELLTAAFKTINDAYAADVWAIAPEEGKYAAACKTVEDSLAAAYAKIADKYLEVFVYATKLTATREANAKQVTDYYETGEVYKLLASATDSKVQDLYDSMRDVANSRANNIKALDVDKTAENGYLKFFGVFYLPAGNMLKEAGVFDTAVKNAKAEMLKSAYNAIFTATRSGIINDLSDAYSNEKATPSDVWGNGYITNDAVKAYDNRKDDIRAIFNKYYADILAYKITYTYPQLDADGKYIDKDGKATETILKDNKFVTTNDFDEFRNYIDNIDIAKRNAAYSQFFATASDLAGVMAKVNGDAKADMEDLKKAGIDLMASYCKNVATFTDLKKDAQDTLDKLVKANTEGDNKGYYIAGSKFANALAAAQTALDALDYELVTVTVATDKLDAIGAENTAYKKVSEDKTAKTTTITLLNYEAVNAYVDLVIKNYGNGLVALLEGGDTKTIAVCNAVFGN